MARPVCPASFRSNQMQTSVSIVSAVMRRRSVWLGWSCWPVSRDMLLHSDLLEFSWCVPCAVFLESRRFKEVLLLRPMSRECTCTASQSYQRQTRLPFPATQVWVTGLGLWV